MPDTDNKWRTTRMLPADDLAYDMHVNVVTFEPGGSIPFAETHVMEHGLYVLEGKAVYHLNGDWVEVQAGDYHVAAGVLPAGLLRRRAGRTSATCCTRTSTARSCSDRPDQARHSGSRAATGRATRRQTMSEPSPGADSTW